MRSKLFATAGLGLALLSTTAFAVPTFSLGGYVGDISIKVQNFELFYDPANNNALCAGPIVGCVNAGVLSVTNIYAGISEIWSQGGTNGYITGVFNDITVANNDGGTPAAVDSTGGKVVLSLNDANLDPSLGSNGFIGGLSTGNVSYTGITNTGGSFLTLDFTPGCDQTTTTWTVCGSFNNNTLPATGSVQQSFLSVTGGAYASMFDNNGFTTTTGATADFQSANTFYPADVSGEADTGDWQLFSNDPITSEVITVPEPATIALMGIGIAGLGFGARRRKV
jgi:hypothetical protein